MARILEEAPGVKILAVSGGMVLDRTGPPEDAEALRADASLSKPFAVGEFRAAVEGLLRA